MSLNPPPRWTLYRAIAEIDGRLYRVPLRWCVLVRFTKVKVVGPTQDDAISFPSALATGVLSYQGEGRCESVGHVQSHWCWNPEKGLLTEDEVLAGETGEGCIYV